MITLTLFALAVVNVLTKKVATISGVSFTIVISRGDVYMLGEAYAFGVVWSFAMKALSVLVLRYKQPGGREW